MSIFDLNISTAVYGSRERRNSKGAVRKRMRARIAAISPSHRDEAVARATANLVSLSLWPGIRYLLGYLSFDNELSADSILRIAIAEGKAVFVPCIVGKDLKFCQITSMEAPFRVNAYGVREPGNTSPGNDFMTTPGPTLILIPGLAFDTYGGRLGRGGGYYDRYLIRIRQRVAISGVAPPACVGYAFEEQVMRRIPRCKDDAHIDALVTDKYPRLLHPAFP